MAISYFNPMKTFLSAYDTCIQSASPDYCRNSVSSSTPAVVDVYLKTYENCRRIMSADSCQKILAPDQNQTLQAIPLVAIGFIFGAVIFGKKG